MPITLIMVGRIQPANSSESIHAPLLPRLIWGRKPGRRHRGACLDGNTYIVHLFWGAYVVTVEMS